MDDYRETLWGISPRDRGWFQLFTLLGGVTGSIILAVLELNSPLVDATLAETARNIVLGIGASFVAAGFTTWGLLQAREMMSSVAAWIREATRKRQERLLEEGRRQGREETLREIYGPDYKEPPEGNPGQSGDSDDTLDEGKANGV